ncbi:cell division protein FtsZ [Ostreibacterium oceani]|uniref:Cell division protein FtsZ n=1 Tax=Ostreibacterium oceani TaxID=2654998 RepID=A0A6N7F0G7_9GAMM|nr:cell division protein FtsZ [Ostreibacterium oceani]
MFELMDNSETGVQPAVIKVIGVGGGGGNAVQYMMDRELAGVELYCANTDLQALHVSPVKNKVQLGKEVTRGLGAGANPEIGRKSAVEDKEKLVSILDGTDMLFIAAGMGGGTGTGAAPVIAEIAKELGILTVAVVTKPFTFEGNKRGQAALAGISELSDHVDSLITIPNDRLLAVMGKSANISQAFDTANGVLFGAVQGISDLIVRPGLINVDFADVKTVMSERGIAMMGAGTATGENRAQEAASQAISSPLLENIDLSGAKGVLVNITGGEQFALDELETVGNIIRGIMDEDAMVVIGTVIDKEIEDELRVTIVATGIDNANSDAKIASKAAAQASQAAPAKAPPEPKKRGDSPFELDIPAFLRKKVD